MGTPKHDLKLPDGRTMIETVAATVGDVCESLIILGADEIMPHLPHVHDLRDGQGPLAGIEALLASGMSDRYLVVTCDVPRIWVDILHTLVDAPDAPVAAIHVEGREHAESLPLRIDATALPEVQRMLDDGRRAVHGLLATVSTQCVAIPAERAVTLVNVNTPDDLASLDE